LVNLNKYWHLAIASLNKSIRHPAGSRRDRKELERDILALTTENQTLAGRLEEIRVDSGRRGLETSRKIDALEHMHRQTEAAGIAAVNKLAELEQLLVGTEDGRKLARQQLTALEASLAETARRLDTRDNQLKFLQDSAREQLQAFKTALVETSSRLETRDNELTRLQEAAHAQIAALETSLAEAVNRFETTDSELRDLRAAKVEQGQQLETYLASTTAMLEASNNQVRALEKKLEIEHRLQQNRFEDTQAQLRKQTRRLGWVMLAALLSLVLAAAAGALLIRGVV